MKTFLIGSAIFIAGLYVLAWLIAPAPIACIGGC